MATIIQTKLGSLTLPATPSPANTLPDFTRAVSVWTKQAQQTFIQMQKTLTGLTTADIPSTPAGLYWTQALFDAAFAAKTTDDLAEGATNLYFTTTRARAAISATAPVLYDNTTGIISMHVADTTHDGYLSSTDWNTFNNKQNALTFPLAVSLGGTGTINRTLTDSTSFTSIDWQNRQLCDAVGQATVYWAFRALADAGNLASLNWDNRQAYDTFGSNSVDWAARQLFGPVTTLVLDWNTLTLFGTWTADGTNFTNLNASNLASGTVASARLTKAKADGSTLGIAAFTAADFNDNGAGLISLDYVNGQKADATHNGFLTSTDWNTFNAGVAGSVPSTRLINTTSPLAGGGNLSADRTISIANAAADGTTKGAATFTAADFNDNGSGLISLDYANGQKASASVPGFLSSTDWTTFNNKVSTTRAINTSSPLAGGGDLSADRTISIANAAANGSTKGAATFTAADFNDNGSGLISIDYTNGQVATTSQPGFLTATDWNTFNNKQAALTGVQGDIIFFSATNTISNLAKNTTASRYLSNSGTSNNPAWAQVDLTNGVTGTLPVGNGGTGTGTAFTAGSVVFAGASGVYSQNNSKFFWDNTAVALCIGTATQAGAVTVVGATGAANTAGQVGSSITGGVGGTSSNASAAGAGGAITVTTGAGGVGSSSGAGGAGGLLTLQAGNGAAGSLGNAGIGGQVTIKSGNGTLSSGGANSTSAGGLVAISSGTGGSGTGAAGSSAGGNITLTTGAGGNQTSSNAASGAGGSITISCGSAGSNGTSFGFGTTGGSITITPGIGSGSSGGVPGGAGGSLTLNSGTGGNSSAAAGGAGGSLTILAGSAGSGGATGANGGAITINPGAGAGTGVTGTVSICNTRGNCAVGNIAPTAQLHIAAGSTSLAPLKLTSGSLLTSAAAGAVEFLTDKFYGTITTGPSRKEFTMNDGTLTSGRVPFATTNGRLIDAASLQYTGAIFQVFGTNESLEIIGAGAGASGNPAIGCLNSAVNRAARFGLVTSANAFITGTVADDAVFQSSNGSMLFQAGSAVLKFNGSGQISFAASGAPSSITAMLHLPAGTASANTAPLKFTSGTNLTTGEAGAMEYNGTNLFFTRSGTTRENIICASAVTTEVVVSDTTVTINVNGTTYKLLAKA